MSAQENESMSYASTDMQAELERPIGQSAAALVTPIAESVPTVVSAPVVVQGSIVEDNNMNLNSNNFAQQSPQNVQQMQQMQNAMFQQHGTNQAAMQQAVQQLQTVVNNPAMMQQMQAQAMNMMSALTAKRPTRFADEDAKVFNLRGSEENCACLFGRAGGFDKNIRYQNYVNNMPQELAKMGMPNALWTEQMRKLISVQGNASGFFNCMRFSLGLSIPGLMCGCIGCPIIIAAYYMVPWAETDPFQKEMKTWLQEFNNKLAEQNTDIFVKAFCDIVPAFNRRQMVNSNRLPTGPGDQTTLAYLVFAKGGSQTAVRQAEILRGHQWNMWGCPAHLG
eukprot:gene844-934_t